MTRAVDGFTNAELRKLRSLKTPYGIQRFLDDLPYHLATTAWSPRRVLAERTAHCLEAAIFATAALRVLGFPPLVFDVEAERNSVQDLADIPLWGYGAAVAAYAAAGTALVIRRFGRIAA